MKGSEYFDFFFFSSSFRILVRFNNQEMPSPNMWDMAPWLSSCTTQFRNTKRAFILQLSICSTL